MRTNKIGAIILGGIALILGMIILSVTVIAPLYLSFVMRSWQPQPAQLIEAKVATREVFREEQQDIPYFYPDIKYQYRVNGSTYIGTRLDLNLLIVVNEERAKDVVAQVIDSAQSGLSVYVNPDNPSQAIYYKTPYWRLLFAMGCFGGLFILSGVGIISLGFTKQINRREALLSHPEQKAKMVKFAVGTLFAVYGMFASYWLFAGVWQTAIALIALLPVAWVAAYAVRINRAVERYAGVTLEVSKPVFVGGELHASVFVPEPLQLEDSYQATLRSLQYHLPNNATNRLLLERWVTAVSAEAHPQADGTIVTVCIDVPYDRHPSGKVDKDRFFWLLHLKNTCRGSSFDREFELEILPAELESTKVS